MITQKQIKYDIGVKHKNVSRLNPKRQKSKKLKTFVQKLIRSVQNVIIRTLKNVGTVHFFKCYIFFIRRGPLW